MKRKTEKVPGFDEILFENRNKEYGAYDLRKKYNTTECYSILGGIALFTALVFGLTFTTEDKGSANIEKTIVVVKFDPVDPELQKLKVQEPPRQIIDKRPVYSAPEVVPDTNVKSSDFVITGILIDTQKDRNVDDTVVAVDNPSNDVPAETIIRTFVEEMPVFPGGNEALLKYISETIKYPEEAIQNGIQGRITVKFVVASDGTVKMAEILRGVHPVLDQEAIRVVTSMPKWKPGRQNGEAVPVWFFVPVTFKLKNN
jgi:protein TonB